jgi:hypothetical protein
VQKCGSMHDKKLTDSNRFVEKPSQPADRNERSGGRLQDPTGRPAILRKYANTCHQCAWCAHGLNGHGGTSAKAPSAKPRKRRTSGVPRCFSEERTDWTTQGCGGIYAARTELLAHCVSASRLESLTFWFRRFLQKISVARSYLATGGLQNLKRLHKKRRKVVCRKSYCPK